MNAHVCSAVFYRLEHSTFCVFNTVLSPQVFLVSLMKTDYSERVHMQPCSDQIIQKVLQLYMSNFLIFISIFFALHHTAASVFFSVFLKQVFTV